MTDNVLRLTDRSTLPNEQILNDVDNAIRELLHLADAGLIIPTRSWPKSLFDLQIDGLYVSIDYEEKLRHVGRCRFNARGWDWPDDAACDSSR